MGKHDEDVKIKIGTEPWKLLLNNVEEGGFTPSNMVDCSTLLGRGKEMSLSRP